MPHLQPAPPLPNQDSPDLTDAQQALPVGEEFPNGSFVRGLRFAALPVAAFWAGVLLWVIVGG